MKASGIETYFSYYSAILLQALRNKRDIKLSLNALDFIVIFYTSTRHFWVISQLKLNQTNLLWVFEITNLEGKRRFWLKPFLKKDSEFEKKKKFHPIITL